MSEIKEQTKFNSLIQLSNYLSDEDKCLQYIEEWRWKGTIHCPHCGMDKIYRFRTRKIFKCKSCNNQFSVKVGTIFEKSKVELKKWILAIYLNGANKKGISSHQLAREIEVTQKTAWFMLHRIRKALVPDTSEQLEGVVMSDETFVGGKNKNRHADKKFKNAQGRSFKDKTPVLGLMQTDGDVRCFVIGETSKEDMHPLIRQHVKVGSVFVSDEWRAYIGIEDAFQHEVVRHNKKQYLSDAGFTTNALEGFWSHLKRTIFGIYHNVTRKHLQRYVDEISFRYNTRLLKQGERFELTMSRINTRLTYKQLVYGS
jgi:transposase-like protein